MSRIQYEAWAPNPAARALVRRADEICAEYAAAGYDLTLRQLYYQFVARALIPNTQQSYKRLGEVINRARMAGLLDWDYIVDRTRNLRGTSHWSSPAEIVESAARSYRLDKWADQDLRIEVWVEKDALAGVIQRAADRHDLDWFACRGYVSQSEMWSAAQRIAAYLRAGQRIVILHLGDHDPSGIDMSRDITDRLAQFIAVDWSSDPTSDTNDVLEGIAESEFDGDPAIQVRRIALNFSQIERYNPPPNPAKLTDSRASSYLRRYGTESWELDALDPAVLEQLVTSHVEALVDHDRYQNLAQRERAERQTLNDLAGLYDDVTTFVAERQDQKDV